MKEKSIIERGIKDTKAITGQLTKNEKKMFNKMKRSLLRTFINPNHSVKMLIDIAALEYTQYCRSLCRNGANHSRVAKSIIDCLSELDLTPKSKKATEVTKTLSQIFQNITQEG